MRKTNNLYKTQINNQYNTKRLKLIQRFKVPTYLGIIILFYLECENNRRCIIHFFFVFINTVNYN